MYYFDKNRNPKQLSPLNLAFIGDCVYEMLVRETLVQQANRPVNDLHRESVKFVSAKAQTEAYDKIKAARGMKKNQPKAPFSAYTGRHRIDVRTHP